MHHMKGISFDISCANFQENAYIFSLSNSALNKAWFYIVFIGRKKWISAVFIGGPVHHPIKVFLNHWFYSLNKR